MKNAINSLSKEEILRIRGAYTAKYGIVPDDSLTCLLCELSEVSAKIDQSVRPYQMNSFWTAFAFGLGKYGMALIIFCCIVLLFMYRNYYGSIEQKEKFDSVNQTLNKYHNIADFEDFIKDSKRVINPTGLPLGTYLTFTVSKTVKNGFSSSTQGILKSDSIVYVPLYFSPESEGH
ncbi:MAG: hypothetical protein H7339_16295 [Arcicella sp.]|nr:hypothetical protein [Arcicella sp.]